MNHTLGFDIGGANIKWFHTSDRADSVPFAMWRHPLLLAESLIKIANQLPSATRWVATMTGEMADIFRDRHEGVRTIVEQTSKAASSLNVDHLSFYAIPGRFLGAADAIQNPQAVASANWHALANWVSTWIDRPSLLIDIGSTTADIIPVSCGRVDTPSITDHDRLCRGELVYLGAARTPVCSLVTTLPLNGRDIPVMREVFATTDDCSLLLNWTAEAPVETDTCDGQPRTRVAAANRLARMIGLDHRSITLKDAEVMAKDVMRKANQHLWQAVKRHPVHASTQWVLSGHGQSMLMAPDGVHVINLAERLGVQVSRVAPAFAICEALNFSTSSLSPSNEKSQ